MFAIGGRLTPLLQGGTGFFDLNQAKAWLKPGLSSPGPSAAAYNALAKHSPSFRPSRANGGEISKLQGKARRLTYFGNDKHLPGKTFAQAPELLELLNSLEQNSELRSCRSCRICGQGFYPKMQDKHSLEKSSPEVPNSRAPELLQLLNSEF